MRHGETEWNIQRRYQGQMDSPLTEKGRSGILNQQKKLKDLSFTKVYCSPLGRCRQTLELLEPSSATICLDNRLMEFHLGILQGKTHDQVPEHHQDQQKIFWENPALFQMEGAETFLALEERVSCLLNEIKDSSGQYLLITHTIIIKMIFKILENRKLENLWDKPFLFPGTILSFDKGETGYTLNDIQHPEGRGKPIKAYTA